MHHENNGVDQNGSSGLRSISDKKTRTNLDSVSVQRRRRQSSSKSTASSSSSSNKIEEENIIYEMKLVDNVIRSMRVGKVFRYGAEKSHLARRHFQSLFYSFQG